MFIVHWLWTIKMNMKNWKHWYKLWLWQPYILSSLHLFDVFCLTKDHFSWWCCKEVICQLHIYIHIYKHIYTHTWIYVCIHTYIHTYEVCPENVQPLLIWWDWFVQHRCNLVAKESGQEYTCMNNDDFTVLVGGGGRHCWVSMCTVWPLHSKWLSE